MGDLAYGFQMLKFRIVRSDGARTSAIDYVDTDLPLMRMAEAYLTYAEASVRKLGPNSDAESKLKKGDNVIFTAFGAGFVHGASFYKWAYDGSAYGK